MRRRTRLALLAGSIGLIVPVAVTSSAASAVDQDLVVSAASGPAGTRIEVSSASCVTDDPESGFERFLSVRLIAGTAPTDLLAGAGSSYGDLPAVMTVPDWIDPAEPAVIEAICIEVDFSPDPIPEVITPFDPVAFDVEASVDLPVQGRTFSRTSLQAGQGFALDAEGCFLTGAEYGSVDVVAGDDLSGRTMGEYISSGGDDLDGESFRALTAMSNGGSSWGVFQTGDGPPEVEIIEETPTDIPVGTYTAIPYCGTRDGDLLLFEPQLIEITGDAPFGDIDLTVAPESTVADLVGGSCTSGNVEAQLDGYDAQEIFEEEPPFVAPGGMGGSDAILRSADTVTASAFASEAPESAQTDGVVRRSNATLLAANGGSKALADDGFLEVTVTPDGSGSWATSDDAGFPIGIVEGYAFCGDPLEEGFLYDPQVAAVQVTPPEPTTTTTTTAPPSPPANAVSGTPTYAG